MYRSTLRLIGFDLADHSLTDLASLGHLESPVKTCESSVEGFGRVQNPRENNVQELNNFCFITAVIFGKSRFRRSIENNLSVLLLSDVLHLDSYAIPEESGLNTDTN